jgi:hypothetical protein
MFRRDARPDLGSTDRSRWIRLERIVSRRDLVPQPAFNGAIASHNSPPREELPRVSTYYASWLRSGFIGNSPAYPDRLPESARADPTQSRRLATGEIRSPPPPRLSDPSEAPQRRTRLSIPHPTHYVHPWRPQNKRRRLPRLRNLTHRQATGSATSKRTQQGRTTTPPQTTSTFAEQSARSRERRPGESREG